MSMQSDLNITLVQCDLMWENPQANRYKIEQLLDESSPSTDLILLPEMFPTGFTMNNTELAELPGGESFKWMVRMAKKHAAVIAGSVITRVPNTGGSDLYYNRLYWVNPDGTYHTYDKRHLFSFAGENNHYSAGNERLIATVKGWKVCPLICYDLRFPVWSRNASLDGEPIDFEYDVLCYVANWPEARQRAWVTLLEARAHENQCYVAGVNRSGVDGNSIAYKGESAVYSPKGEKLYSAGSELNLVKTLTLSRDELISFREKFGAWKDKDTFRLFR
ncbi:MAG: amidohydrolase [Salibacteraceae bacterium]